MGKNTKIHYQYRDADNYKQLNECVINGVLSLKQQAVILSCLTDGEYFIPSKVGLPEKRFETWTDADHVWFEIAPDDFTITEEPANVSLTSDELVSAFCRHKHKWEQDVLKEDAPIQEDMYLTLDGVDAVVGEWFYSFRKGAFDNATGLDIESETYKEILDMYKTLCLREFPELYEAVFVAPGEVDLIFRDRHDSEGYNLFYYNPDSTAGGQIVQCPFDLDDAPAMIDNENYVDVLASHVQYLHDIDSEHFFNALYEMLELKKDGFYLGDNVNTVCRDIIEKDKQSIDSLISDASKRSKQDNMNVSNEEYTLE